MEQIMSIFGSLCMIPTQMITNMCQSILGKI
ncbi:MAG: hypothetical protein MASP_00517 [Candidatus Methanolliviera sp. GoM_asphalt]|nr:MAG: hypothetical protein MASP_00517 [Candidatus Methanolliviera sp. GoM_asphalt]